jgi:hypothetical protein
MKKLFAFAEHNLRVILIHSLSVLAILLLPALGHASVSFKWVPTDGSSSSGVMTIDAPSSGGFSVPPTAVTLFGFSFGPGKSVSLDNAQTLNAVNGQGQMIPIVSFNGKSLDTGVFDLRLLANPAVDVYITFIYTGSDASQYDPGGQEIRAHGNWVRATEYTFKTIDVPGATVTWGARGINNHGQIVGSYGAEPPPSSRLPWSAILHQNWFYSRWRGIHLDQPPGL